MKDRFIHALAALGAVVLAATIAVDHFTISDLERVGMILLLLGYTEARMRRLPRRTAMYELGRMEGHREGYDEGRRARLAPVTHLHPAGDLHAAKDKLAAAADRL